LTFSSTEFAICDPPKKFVVSLSSVETGILRAAGTRIQACGVYPM
jgi:hypothetical protein